MDVDVAAEGSERLAGGDGDVIDLRPNQHDEGAEMTVWVSVAEAAEKAGLSTSTVRQWYRSGRIPTQRSEGEHGAFLVPVETVLALARMADDTGDAVGAALVDLNANYWSEETRQAREEATAARAEAAAASAEAGELRTALDEATGQLTFLRTQLAESAEDDRRHRAEIERLGGELRQLQHDLDEAETELDELEAAKHALEEQRVTDTAELNELRAMTGRASSIVDNSWLDMDTPAYRSPVRPQARLGGDLPPAIVAGGIANLLAQTMPDGPPAGSRSEGDEDAGEDDEVVEDEAEPAVPPMPFNAFGDNEDDLLPEPEKPEKKRRKR